VGRFLSGLIALCLIAAAGLMIYPQVAASQVKLPPLKIGEGSVIYASDGSVLGHINATGAGHPLTDEQVSPLVREAHLAAEDRTFYTDGAISYWGLVRAFGADIVSRSLDAGGSTISQQYVKEAYLSADKTWQRKLNEATYAYRLESDFTKDQILTKYVNINYYGRGANGVEDGAQAWFGHSATTLNDVNNPQQVAEAAFLAALVNQPSYYAQTVPGHSDQLVHRDDLNARVLYTLDGLSKVEPGKNNAVTSKDIVSAAVVQQAKALVPTLRITGTQNITTGPIDGDPYIIDYVKDWLAAWQTQLVKEDDPSLKDDDAAKKGQSAADALLARGGGLAIHTSINPGFQKLVAQAVAAKLPKTGLSSGVVIEDPTNGAIVAAYAGADHSKDAFNYAFYGNRQVGSTMKTVVLTDAVNKGVSVQSKFAAPAYVQLSDGTKVWNDNKQAAPGCVLTLANAAALSNNPVFTEAITGQMASCSNPAALSPIDGYEVTPKSVADLAHRMGADDSLVPGKSNPAALDAVPSLALGTSSLTPLTMASISSTLANGGMHTKPHLIDSVAQSDGTVVFQNEVESNQVVSAQTANIVNQTMTGVFTKGTAIGAQVTNHPLAGKTGTTDSDAWMIAWSAHADNSPQFACSAWAGYPDNRVTSKAGGDLWGADVAKICQAFFAGALADQPRVDFPKANLAQGTLVGLK